MTNCASPIRQVSAKMWGNPGGDAAAVKLILSRHIDPIYEDGRILCQIAGLAHHNSGRAVEPDHAVDQTFPPLARNYGSRKKLIDSIASLAFEEKYVPPWYCERARGELPVSRSCD